MLEGALWILNTGVEWHTLPQCYPNYKTVHRRFQHWCERDVLREILAELANTLRDEGEIDEREYFIDARFVSGKGVKILAIVDRHGLPLSVSTHAANHHEVTLVQLSFDFYMIEAKPQNPIGDRAYDSDTLDQELRKDGVELIAPHLIQPEDEDPGRSPPVALRASLDRREVLCVDPMEAPVTGSMGVLRLKPPRIRAACVHRDAAKEILR